MNNITSKFTLITVIILIFHLAPQTYAMEKSIKRHNAEAPTQVSNQRTQEQLNNDLMEAAKCGKSEEIEFLIQAGADVNARYPQLHTIWPGYCSTPLHIAAQYDNIVALELLIAHNADIETQNASQETALHSAAFWKNPYAILKLIKAGANIEAKDALGETPLFKAARGLNTNRLGPIQMLIEFGADINAMRHDNKTVLDVTLTEYNNRASTRILLTTVSPQEVQHVIPAIIALTNPLNDPEKENNLNNDVGYIIAHQLIPAIVQQKLALAKWHLFAESKAILRQEIEQSIKRVLSRNS